MNEKIEVPTMQVPPIKKICMTIGQLPSSYIETMSYYEMLVWFVNYLRDDIIPVVNANGEATRELQELYIQLQEYVNNYFDNLDVQEEINNKLDEMAESGELEEIIATYLNTKAIFAFDSVADLKSATNLINGSYAKTLGYYSKNDGGNALYKIRNVTNDDVVDDMFIIELTDPQNQLIAELIYGDKVNLKQIGAKGDNTQDDTLYFQKALTKCKTIYLSNGKYKITENCLIDNKVDIIGCDSATLHFTDGTENICPNTNGRINMFNVKIESDAGIVYHINRTGIKDTKIENCNITGAKYPILVNATSDGGENIVIDNNTILTPSDGVEINTTSDTSDKFKNVFITNNKISVIGGSGVQAGFGIGVADGKNVLISNNIVDNCRLEAIHIEDTSKKIVVTNNILTNCQLDGIRILTMTSNKEKHIIQNNYMSGANKQNIGINLVWDANGKSDYYNIGNNTIENFDTGFPCVTADVDGLEIINCNKAVSDSGGEYLKGNITLINTPKFGDFNSINSLVIDSITTPDVINPATYITCSHANKLITIKNMKYTVENDTTQTGTTDINFLKCPTYLDVILEVTMQAKTANYGKAVVHVTYNSTDGLNYEILTDFNNGVFSNLGRIKLDAESNMLQLNPYNPNETGVETVFVQMTGNIVIKGNYNN